MEPKKIVRDESTPDRKEIWSFVERAAARSDDAIRNAQRPGQDERELHAGGSDQE